MSALVLQGDALAVLRTLPAESVHCCITSPPYYQQRSYLPSNGHDKPLEIGLEESPEHYIARLAEIFREVRRVLRRDGSLWLNIDDKRSAKREWLGIPHRLVHALQADGWRWEDEIIWEKPDGMPFSGLNRCTHNHEYLFLLNKSTSAYFDAVAIREPDKGTDHLRTKLEPPEPSGGLMPAHKGIRIPEGRNGRGRNKRSVWSVPTARYGGAHTAVFPPALIEPCILSTTSDYGACPECGAPWRRIVEWEGGNWDERKAAGAPPRYGQNNNKGKSRTHEYGGSYPRTIDWCPTCECCSEDSPVNCVVLDPFAGSGTVGEVAVRNGHDAILIELNPEYCELIEERIHGLQVRLL
ncbi:MAG: site-specific DNA-methyltransferase [Gemmatimonadota bacterium]